MGKREDSVDTLPKKLIDLLERSESLYRRISRLDEVLFRQGTEPAGAQAQFAMLAAAFGSDTK
jgi:hypothetical protein